MCNPAAFILLLAIAYNPLHLPQGTQLWGPLAKKLLREGAIQLLSDSSLFSITQRLTKPRTTTTIFVSCSRKHTRFKSQGSVALASIAAFPSDLHHAPPREHGGVLRIPEERLFDGLECVNRCVDRERWHLR
jgi:hypothetical protein